MTNSHLGIKDVKDLENELENSNSGIMDESHDNDNLDFYQKDLHQQISSESPSPMFGK